MRIESFSHKGLRLLYEEDSIKGIEASTAGKLRLMLSVMAAATSLDDVASFSGWRMHSLKGALTGTWSLAVTGNRRLTFQYDEATNTAGAVDLVDYH
ncbi:MAG: Killer protein [Rhizobacter sp.]|nr:Killer protein [Rhizobacter sp.]